MQDGSPGPNFAKAHQFKIVSAPNGGKFFAARIWRKSNSTRRYRRPMWPALARCRPIFPF